MVGSKALIGSAVAIYAGLIAFSIAVLIGWVMNIITIIGLETITFTGVNVLRIVGVFVPPLGGIMGWFF